MNEALQCLRISPKEQQSKNNNCNELEQLRRLHKQLPSEALSTENALELETRLLFYLNDRKSDALTRMSVNCLGNMLGYSVPDDWPSEKFLATFERIFQLAKSAVHSNKLLLNSCLRAMNIILQSGKLTMNRPIAELIQLIYASLFTAVSAVKSGGALVNNASQQSASDSESGSSEVYYQPPATRKLRSDQQIMQDEEMKSTAPSSQDERLQLNALLLLQTISKCFPKQFFPYWSLFLIDGLTGQQQQQQIIPASNPSLFCLLAFNQSGKVRIAAANCLSSMFHASHSFLSIASARMQSTKQAFTSYSEKLGDLLVKTHEFVLLSIEADFGEADIVEQKFKSLHEVIMNTPYNRLSLSVVQRLASQLSSIAIKQHQNLQDLALNNLRALLRRPLTPAQLNSVRVSLFSVHLIAGLTADDGVRLSIAALRLFTACAELFPQQTAEKWPIIKDSILKTREISEEYAEAGLGFVQVLLAHCESPELHESCLRDVLLSILLREKNHKIIELCLDAVAVCCPVDITSCMEVVELTVAFAKHQSHRLRAAACKPIGRWLTWSAVRADLSLFTRLADLILILSSDKQSPLVRLRSCWSLANLADSLLPFPANCVFMEWINNNQIVGKILYRMLSLEEEQKQSQHNCLRGIGSAIQIASDQDIVEYSGRCLDCLLRGFKSSQMKSKWNACRAAGSALNNPKFPAVEQLVKALIESVQCKNFKVRIQASAALGQLKQTDDRELVNDSTRALFNCVKENVEYAIPNYESHLSMTAEIDDIRTVATASNSADRYRQLLFHVALQSLQKLCQQGGQQSLLEELSLINNK